MARRALLATLALCALAQAGCGGSPGQTEEEAERSAEAKALRSLSQRVPKGASSFLRALYAHYPPPRPDPNVRGSAQAIAAGERACEHKRPTELKEELYGAAKAKLNPEQRRALAQIGRDEARAARDPSYAAAQLAADVYAASLPEALSRFGYEGCVYALARGLEGRVGGG